MDEWLFFSVLQCLQFFHSATFSVQSASLFFSFSFGSMVAYNSTLQYSTDLQVCLSLTRRLMWCQVVQREALYKKYSSPELCIPVQWKGAHWGEREWERERQRRRSRRFHPAFLPFSHRPIHLPSRAAGRAEGLFIQGITRISRIWDFSGIGFQRRRRRRRRIQQRKSCPYRHWNIWNRLYNYSAGRLRLAPVRPACPRSLGIKVHNQNNRFYARRPSWRDADTGLDARCWSVSIKKPLAPLSVLMAALFFWLINEINITATWKAKAQFP